MSLTRNSHRGAVLLVCLLGGAWVSSSEPPQLRWETAFDEGNEDRAVAVLQMQDGSLVAVGWSETNTVQKRDAYIVKTDPDGALLWSRTYGSMAFADDAAAVALAPDGGIVVAGQITLLEPLTPHMFLLKLRADGSEEWSSFLPYAIASAVRHTEDGGYIVAGYRQARGGTTECVCVVKTDDRGNLQWERFFSDLGPSIVYDIDVAPDGGCVVVGSVMIDPTTSDDVDGLVIRLDADGRMVWRRAIDRSEWDHLNAVVCTFDGGYAMAGASGAVLSGAYFDLWLLRLDAAGGTLWSKAYGGAGNEFGNALVQTRDGGFCVAGFILEYEEGSNGMYLLKTDETGNKLWSLTPGERFHDRAHAVCQLDDGGYGVAGTSMAFTDLLFGDMYLARFAPDVPLRRFIRGDANASGCVDIADAVAVIWFIFRGSPIPCVSAADVNDDDATDLADAIVILTALFGTSADKPVLAARCDLDTTGRDLGCTAFPPCE